MIRIRSLSSLTRLARSSLTGPAGPVFPEQEDQLAHPRGDLLEPLHERLNFLGADRKLLDQVDGLAPPPLEVVQERAAERVVAFPDERLEVADVAFHQVDESDQVMRHSAQDLVFFKVLGDRHLDRAVERKLAVVDLLEHIDDQGQGKVALEHLAAEPLAGDLDAFGEVDFLLAGQERDLTHLGQIHADRVVDPPRDLVEIFGRELGFLVIGGLVGRRRRARHPGRPRRAGGFRPRPH